MDLRKTVGGTECGPTGCCHSPAAGSGKAILSINGGNVHYPHVHTDLHLSIPQTFYPPESVPPLVSLLEPWHHPPPRCLRVERTWKNLEFPSFPSSHPPLDLISLIPSDHRTLPSSILCIFRAHRCIPKTPWDSTAVPALLSL